MDCRQFRKLHAQFLDDTLSGVATWTMRDHLTVCAPCARLDAQLRRALMLARSAPLLEVSPEFERKLSARIAAERLAGRSRHAQSRWSVRAPIAIAAMLVAAVGLGFVAVAGSHSRPGALMAMAPIVVTPPTLPTEPVAAPAMFATVSSSLPVYPAMLLAQRATAQFAATHARTVSFQATH
jgi:hypothetical protein